MRQVLSNTISWDAAPPLVIEILTDSDCIAASLRLSCVRMSQKIRCRFKPSESRRSSVSCNRCQSLIKWNHRSHLINASTYYERERTPNGHFSQLAALPSPSQFNRNILFEQMASLFLYMVESDTNRKSYSLHFDALQFCMHIKHLV